MELNLIPVQKHQFSQQMQQSVKILQMNIQQLYEYLTELSLENPVMEVEQSEPYREEKDPALLKKIEWLNSFGYEESDGTAPYEEEEKIPKRGQSLKESLKEQITVIKLEERERKRLEYLIENLNQDGYLMLSEDQFRKECGCTKEEAAQILKILQRLSPPGVGAKDLKECLMLQIDRAENVPDFTREVVQTYLKELSKNQLGKIAGKLQIPLKQVKKIKDFITKLNPKPGNGYFSGEDPTFIHPDLLVVSCDGHFEVFLNRFYYPTIHMNKEYLGLAQNSDAETSNYINKKARQAQWLIRCMQQRENTLLKCANAILKHQENFFRLGPGHQSPLTLSMLAEELSIHESTVSRAIHGKYLKCMWGSFSLSQFFSRKMGNEKENFTQDNVMLRLKQIIKEENKQKPLSDQKIAEKLKENGMEISRRTVTKYREKLGIPIASKRGI